MNLKSEMEEKCFDIYFYLFSLGVFQLVKISQWIKMKRNNYIRYHRTA